VLRTVRKELVMKTARFALSILLTIFAGCATSRTASQGADRRSAIAYACAGVPESELDTNPLHSGRVVAVEPLRDSPYSMRGSQVLRGATVVIAASPGMTQQWLQRLLECNAARQALVGSAHVDDLCTLALGKEVPTVGARSDSFAVNLRANDSDEAKVLLKECGALVSR
jgi:hypothetical protein